MHNRALSALISPLGPVSFGGDLVAHWCRDTEHTTREWEARVERALERRDMEGTKNAPEANGLAMSSPEARKF
jgi:hypothetical protein